MSEITYVNDNSSEIDTTWEFLTSIVSITTIYLNVVYMVYMYEHTFVQIFAKIRKNFTIIDTSTDINTPDAATGSYSPGKSSVTKNWIE